ncbi:hypothetical protein CR513_57414, partial [Mucuna pruriens]
MAWAKPSTKVTSIWQWNATQMCANPDHNEPFWVLHSICILLGIAKRTNINTVCQLDVILGSAPDEHWLSTPLNGYCGAGLNAGEINLKHAEHKLEDKETDQRGICKSTTCKDKVGKCPLARVTWGESFMVVLIINNLRSRVLNSSNSRRNLRNNAVFCCVDQ